MEISEKFKKLVYWSGKSKYEFSKIIGLERPDNLYNVLNGKVPNPGEELIRRVKLAFPNVSSDFLIGVSDDIEIPTNSLNEIEELKESISELKREKNIYLNAVEKLSK
jgi:hypothetical protein